MRRRNFLQALAAAAIARRAGGAAAGEPKTWLFWDLWKLDGLQGAELRQGRPQWRPELSYRDPLLGSLSSWPTVLRAEDGWRMYYSAEWLPLTLLCAESDDGLRWRPKRRPEFASAPAGANKVAPHHLFTLPAGSGGSVYRDPIASDGYPYKIFAIQSGEITRQRALADPRHFFHELAKAQPEAQRYFVDHLTVKSADGYRWEADYDAVWNQPHWHPEPPVYGYYNHHQRKHFLTSRPGHGERRIVLLHSEDARRWSGPELLLHPDPSDQPLIQFYGMPVFPYGGAYVGLLWTFHPTAIDPPTKYNRSLAWIDCQLAYSYDGVRFNRGFREPFIPLNETGELGGGHIQPSSLVENDDEIRIYSTGGKHTHGMGDRFSGRKSDLAAILLHTLRKDGFHYLASTGSWASFISKPFVLNSPDLLMNAAAPQGEIQYQITTVESEPIPGLEFERSVKMLEQDSIRWKLRWDRADLTAVVGKAIRLQVKWLHGKIYSFRGDFHFIDAQDWHLLNDGRAIDPRWFDY